MNGILNQIAMEKRIASGNFIKKTTENMLDKNDSLLSNLNKEQADAVSAELGRHLLVLAGAGCGKTTVLTRRIAYLVSRGISPDAILALTFSRKAAEEMGSRVAQSYIVEKFRTTPLITTFHGFALRVLSENVLGKKNFIRIGYKGSYRLISGDERLKMLSSLSSNEDRRALGIDLVTLDSLLAKYEVFPEKNENAESQVVTYLRKISEALHTKKQSEGLWDFSDLLSGCLQLFSIFPDIRDYYQQKFNVILVDEFQDTNPVQIQLLKEILSETTCVFAVGDDDQAIYGFRGADIRPTLEFTSYFPGAVITKLQTNYRSVPAILNCANRIFADKNPQYRKILISGRYGHEKGCKPQKYLFGNQGAMVDWIDKQVQKIAAKDKITISKMAILFRVNQSLEWTDAYIKKNRKAIADIRLLTIHKSKGLEFPVVFLCDLEESVFPSFQAPHQRQIHNLKDFVIELFKKRKDIDCDWEEEKRMFYVGVTRAEKYLFLLSARNKKVYGRNRSFESSRYLKYIK